MNLYRNSFLYIFLTVFLISTGGCDLVSSVFNGDKGFENEAGPILYIGKKNKPYSEFHRKQLYTMSMDGSDIRQLTNNKDYEVVDAAWSPDGEYIAMVKNSLDSGTQWGRNLYVVDWKGENEKRLITTENDNYGIRSIISPVWSPDSRKIAFMGITNVSGQGSSGNRDVYIVNVKTKELRKITDTPGVKEVLSKWAKSGLIYGNEHYINPSPKNREKTRMIAMNGQGEIVKAWDKWEKNYTLPLVSHNGNFMVFREAKYEDISSGNQGSNWGQSNSRLRMMEGDIDPDSTRILTKGSFKEYIPVCWSPDDRELLTMGISNNQNRQQGEPPLHYHIIRVNRDGTTVDEITPENENFFYEPVSWIRQSNIGAAGD